MALFKTMAKFGAGSAIGFGVGRIAAAIIGPLRPEQGPMGIGSRVDNAKTARLVAETSTQAVLTHRYRTLTGNPDALPGAPQDQLMVAVQSRVPEQQITS